VFPDAASRTSTELHGDDLRQLLVVLAVLEPSLRLKLMGLREKPWVTKHRSKIITHAHTFFVGNSIDYRVFIKNSFKNAFCSWEHP
jgi:hypothetical protein